METVLGARSGSAFGDGWVRSACTICMNRCGILAHVNEDNVVDKILGDPDNPHNHGRTCAKGDAGFEVRRSGRLGRDLLRAAGARRVLAATRHPAGWDLPAGAHPFDARPAVCRLEGRRLTLWP